MPASTTFYTSGAVIGAIYGTLAPPPPCKYADTAHAKKAPPTSAPTARRIGGQMKTWASTIKTYLFGSRFFCYARWRNGWLKVSNELALDRRSWDAATRDLVNSIGDAGSTG